MTVVSWTRRHSWPRPPPPENVQVGWRSLSGLAGALAMVTGVSTVDRNALSVTMCVASYSSLSRHWPCVVVAGDGGVSYLACWFQGAPGGVLLGVYCRKSPAPPGGAPPARGAGGGPPPGFPPPAGPPRGGP